MRMRVAALVLASFSCLAVGAQGATKPEDLVSPDTFAALCDGAKATVDVAQLKDLLAKAQAQKPKAETQRKAADAEATKALDGLESTATEQGVKIEQEIKGLRGQLAAATAEQDRLSRIMATEKSGPLFESTFRDRDASIAQSDALKAQITEAEGRQSRLIIQLADVQGATGIAAKAEILLNVARELGVSATLAFASPAATWATAKLALVAADATVEAADRAVDCIGKKLATVEEAKGAEAKYLRDNLLRLAKAMQAKGEEVNSAKKAAEATMSRLFTGASEAQIRGAAAAYLQALDQFIALGAEFETELKKASAKGVTVEPWMTQMMNTVGEAKKLAAQAKSKRG